ncbi:MAG: SPFH domain-containing protein [Acidimicrobiaceae bacterium]|uniref:flotillin family protein n=1 Tax=Candidatus Poriferisodalis sp. TaxID=3101277 RepID=UPI0022A2C0ED|nr:SPFH domain-containing protein [Acidimicrobiaceae bacterium]
MAVIALAGGLFAIFLIALLWISSRYKRCPSDRVLVVYGRIGGEGQSARCLHGGGNLIWPIVQGYAYLDLTPIPIEIKLQGALSQQNIRVNTPATFTVGISTEPGVMQNAAERLLGLSLVEIENLARDIIFGQMRVVIATMPIEQINADREQLITNITESLELELRKVGLRLINVNIQDITDESGYIDALGREAAARAINEAKIKVAEQERDGDIGAAEAQREQRIRVAQANATATEGENESHVVIARSASERRQQEAEAERAANAAERVSQAQAEQESFAAETEAERVRAERDKAAQEADVVVPAQVERERVRTLAEAEADRTRLVKAGEADGQRLLMEAEALGLLALLSRRAEGLGALVAASGGAAQEAALLLIAEQLPNLVAEQVKAISNLKIDKITVWDSGSNGDGQAGTTANFVSGLVGALPPLHEVASQAGIKLPQFLGELDDDKALDRLRELAEQLGDRSADARISEVDVVGEDEGESGAGA